MTEELIYRCMKCKNLLDKEDLLIEEDLMNLRNILADFFGINDINSKDNHVMVYFNDTYKYFDEALKIEIENAIKDTTFRLNGKGGYYQDNSEQDYLILSFVTK